jgi:radical SAM protein with 4Fe4S-binding SPASM domain
VPDIQRILDEIKDAGCLWLLLTGGEPLLRRDFLEIYPYAKKKGFLLTLFTNGTLLTPRLVDVLQEWRPFNIEITLYGFSQATYECITGVRGSHTRCMRGIELLLERRLPLKLKTVLTTLNRHELGEMRAFARSLGVEFRFDPIVNACLDGSTRPAAFRLSTEDIISAELSDPARARLWPEHYKQAREYQPPPGKLYTCWAGTNSFHIDSFGRLCLCLTERLPAYNLLTGTFREGWESFIPRQRSLEHSPSYACAACTIRTVCGQCPALAQLENGDPEQRVEFLCQLAHQRQAAFAEDLFRG